MLLFFVTVCRLSEGKQQYDDTAHTADNSTRGITICPKLLTTGVTSPIVSTCLVLLHPVRHSFSFPNIFAPTWQVSNYDQKGGDRSQM
jgi:hypothetical protein